MNTASFVLFGFLGFGLALLSGGCAKNSDDHSPGGAPAPVSRSEPAPKPVTARPSPLSAKEVSARLLTDAPGEQADRRARTFELAASLETLAREPAVVQAVRTRLSTFDAIAPSRQPLFLTLGAESLGVSDVALFAAVLGRALTGPVQNARIAALAIVIRHPELGSAPSTQAALLAALQLPTLSVIERHWLARACRSLYAASAGVGLFVKALADPRLELEELLRGLAPGPLVQLVTAHKAELGEARFALLLNVLEVNKHERT